MAQLRIPAHGITRYSEFSPSNRAALPQTDVGHARGSQALAARPTGKSTRSTTLPAEVCPVPVHRLCFSNSAWLTFRAQPRYKSVHLSLLLPGALAQLPERFNFGICTALAAQLGVALHAFVF